MVRENMKEGVNMKEKSLELRIRTTKKLVNLPEYNKALIIGYVLGCEDTMARLSAQEKGQSEKKQLA